MSCPIRLRIRTDFGPDYVIACRLERGHPGVCKGLDGRAITMEEIAPELRDEMMAAFERDIPYRFE